ncbi:MAG: PAS domain-containing protein, partial [Gemmatimonadetes bacterium]|nr:PAS domain-containing protein [Gemmatimonadota bacterium]
IYPDAGGDSASGWRGGYVAVGVVQVAGREWEFRFLCPPGYGLSRVEWDAWVIVLAGGLSLALFATWSTYSLVASGRAVRSDLQLMNARLRVVLDAALEGILLVDRERRVVWANEAYVNAFGSGRAEGVIGREWSEVAREMAGRLADGGAHLERIEALQDDVTVAVANEDVELAGASQRTLSMTSVPVTGENGAYLGRLWVYRDVTSVRAAERAKSAFVSMVSHELRTPLTSLTGFVDLVLDGAAGPVSEGVERLLRTAKANGKRLETLVRDILEVSRLESGPVMELGAVSLRPVVMEVGDSLAPEFEERGHSLAVDVPDTVPEVWADRSRLGQVVTNLLSNACRYTPQGGRVTVRGRRAESGDAVELSVEDTGIGIPAEYLGRVFERFVRVESGYPRPSGSTGLGLSITKTLVELMGGSIRVESTVGRGSRFTVTLPAAGARAAEAA